MDSVSFTATQLDRFKTVANPIKTNFDVQKLRNQFMNASPRHTGKGLFGQARAQVAMSDVEDNGSVMDGGLSVSESDESSAMSFNEEGDEFGTSPSPPNRFQGGGSPNLNQEPDRVSRPDIDGMKDFYYTELLKMNQTGQSFSRNDSVEDLEFLYNRAKAMADCDDTVRFMKDGLKLVLTSIELGNNWIGPLLSIDGWSAEVTADMDKYDSCLRRIYLKYYRKGGSVNPILQLGVMLVGSLLLYHFKSKMFGPPQSSIGGGGNARKTVAFDATPQPAPVRKRSAMKRPSSIP